MLCDKLKEWDLVKHGEFKLKDGSISPVYINLRPLVSYPGRLKVVGDALFNVLMDSDLNWDLVCGIPYAGIPLALATGLKTIYYRKETKDYGTQKLIEGEYKQGDNVVLIDDVITSGESKLEAAKILEDNGLIVKAVAVVVDRSENGREILNNAGYELFSVTTLKEIMGE